MRWFWISSWILFIFIFLLVPGELREPKTTPPLSGTAGFLINYNWPWIVAVVLLLLSQEVVYRLFRRGGGSTANEN